MLIRLTRRIQESDRKRPDTTSLPLLLNHETVVTIEPGYSGGSTILLTTGGYLHVLETPEEVEARWFKPLSYDDIRAEVNRLLDEKVAA